MATHKVWALRYVAGNPEIFDKVTTDASGPHLRTTAIALAQRLNGMNGGWRIWVEHTRSGERIYQNETEQHYRRMGHRALAAEHSERFQEDEPEPRPNNRPSTPRG